MDAVELVRLDPATLDAGHICCAIGDDKENRARAAVKKEWLHRRLPEGHVFLKADVRGKVFIEYGPAELEWFPVEAPGWFFAQCFWVSGRHAGTGLGARLLVEAEKDASRGAGLCFLASASGKKPFLSDGRYLLSNGYSLVDEALGFGIFAKATKGEAAWAGVEKPRFLEGARTGRLEGNRDGLDLFWSPLCPFVPSVARQMAETAESLGIPARLHEVDSLAAAKALRAPPGVFQAYYDGAFLTHELMIPSKFGKLLESHREGRSRSGCMM